MAEYRFSTLWRIHAPLPSVWEAILHADLWPRWWRGAVQITEMEKGDQRGIGALHRYTWKGVLPYRLTFDMRVLTVEPMQALAGRASGEIEGEGRWHFISDDACTIVRYDWHIRTNTWWLNALTPLARPLFVWNHDQVMRAGARGLAHWLGVPVQMEGRTFLPFSQHG